MITTDLLNYELSNLIRIYNEDALIDATALANRVLAPVISELDRATQKFSKTLFITTALHVLCGDPQATLQQVLDCIVDPIWETESKMLMGISSYRSHKIGGPSVLKWFKDFDHICSNLSVGSAQRIVMRCYAQWCKAFNLHVPEIHLKAMHTSNGNELSTNPLNESLDFIRIGTWHELSDASKLATKVLRGVKGETDETLYTYSHELFITVALMSAHTVRFANIGNVLEFIQDPSWNNHRQIYSHAGQCHELAESKELKTKAFVVEWFSRMLAMPYNMSQSLSKRSHELLQKACLEKSPIPNEKTEQEGQTAIPPNAVQVFNMADVAKAMTLMGDLSDEKRRGGDRLLKNAQENNGYRFLPEVKKVISILEKAKV